MNEQKNKVFTAPSPPEESEEIYLLVNEMVGAITPILLSKTYQLGLNALLITLSRIIHTIAEDCGCNICDLQSAACEIINSYEKHDGK
jgi:hypothetical protein